MTQQASLVRAPNPSGLRDLPAASKMELFLSAGDSRQPGTLIRFLDGFGGKEAACPDDSRYGNRLSASRRYEDKNTFSRS